MWESSASFLESMCKSGAAYLESESGAVSLESKSGAAFVESESASESDVES